MVDGQHKSGSGESLRKRALGLRIGMGVLVIAAGVSAVVLAIRPKHPDERPWIVRSPLVSTTEIGRSVQDRAIRAIRVGTGSRMAVIAAAIHGSETNTTAFVEGLAIQLMETAESLPGDVSLFLVPSLNPDGLARRSRLNARGVDLNRNWDTSNWRPDEAESANGVGGPSPFSEPETAALSSWLLGLRDQSTSRLSVIIYHSACPPKGLIQPGYRIVSGRQETDPNAARLGRHWSSKLGYEYSPTWPEYPITGEAIHWCADNDIACIDIELPTPGDPNNAEVQLHLSALLDMIQQ